jgi:hypothetical protein
MNLSKGDNMSKKIVKYLLALFASLFSCVWCRSVIICIKQSADYPSSQETLAAAKWLSYYQAAMYTSIAIMIIFLLLVMKEEIKMNGTNLNEWFRKMVTRQLGGHF